MTERFQEAASICNEMAASARPAANRRYLRLIEVCKEVEGCCRQAGHWRENHEWWLLADDVHRLQIMMGGWIRAKHRGEAQKRLFAKAAATMAKLKGAAKRKRDAAHGRLGMILPEEASGPLRHRPVAVSNGGIILPDHATLQ